MNNLTYSINMLKMVRHGNNHITKDSRRIVMDYREETFKGDSNMRQKYLVLNLFK